jgi:hypothetical protein
MARIRTIKPEFWSSPSMAGADPWARLLFIAMWNWADDTGRGTANVKELAAFAFPHDDDPGAPTAAELPSLLKEIRGRFDVVFYEVGGRRYYFVPSFDRHQRTERRAGSRHPAPEDGTDYDPCPPGLRIPKNGKENTEVPPGKRGTSVADNGSSGPGTGEQGNRGTGVKDLAIAAATAVRVPDLFDEFWSAYPRKVGKADARKAWPKAVKHLDAERLVKAARWWSEQWDAAGVEKRYVLHPTTWLNGQRWNDEPPAPRRQPSRFESQTDANIVAFLGRTGTDSNVLQLPRGGS